MRAIRRTALVLAVALLGLSGRGEAQLVLSASCYPGVSFPCAFDINQVLATTRPIELASLQLNLSDGWSFASTTASGFDLFGPLPSLAADFGASTSTLVVDFLGALNGPDSCFPYDPLTCAIAGFAVGNAFTPPTLVELTLTPPTLPDGSIPTFSWTATDIDGTVYSSVPVATVVPEPSTWIMLATGLAALGLAYRRREANAAD